MSDLGGFPAATAAAAAAEADADTGGLFLFGAAGMNQSARARFIAARFLNTSFMN